MDETVSLIRAPAHDALTAEATSLAHDTAIRAVLEEVCQITGMGFSAVARVTDDRWIACQVIDRIEFGLDAGDELKVCTTICDDIRKTRRCVVIDHVAADQDWCTHPTPILYGFASYASFPLTLANGEFFGTLCAIDPRPRLLSEPAVIEALQACARRVEAVLNTSR